MANLTGQIFGNYRLVQLLGQGGFADVYLAEHVHLHSRMAVKVLQSRLVGNALEQFRNEGRSIANLVHPNIIRVFDFGIEDGIPFLVMDYAPNGTMRQRYPKGTVLSPASVLPYVKQVAQALQYAHSRKLIHRDIKPENILLGAQGEALLSDFGLVLPAQSTNSQSTKEMAGTLPYMAPEQINGKPRPASDQYALGIVIYEWLSGKRPFEGTFVEIATQHMMTPPPPLYGRVPNVSSAMQEVLFAALAKEPQQRFASIQAFATAFESSYQAGEISASALPTAVDPSAQRTLGDTASAPTESKTQSPTEMATPDASSAPTYIKTPGFNYMPQSPALQTPVVASNLSQGPTEMAALDSSSAPTYIKTPDFAYQQQSPVLHTPSSPQQPLMLTTQPGQPRGASSATWAEAQPTFLLTPDMPPGSRPQRKKGRVGLLVMVCLLIFALAGGGLVYAVWGGSGGSGSPGGSGSHGNNPGGQVAGTSATVTITPASTDLKNTYTITAVTGSPDATQHQVAARMLSATTQAQSKTVNATGQGTTPGAHATGTLIAYNCDPVNPQSLPAGSAITNTYSDGAAPSSLVMVTDAPVNLPPGNPPSNCTSMTIPGHVQQVGTFGNFPQYIHSSYTPTVPLSGGPQAFGHLYGSCPGYCLGIFNNTPFSGGVDPVPFTFVQQSDIDNAVKSLNQPDATQTLQGQIHANERLVSTPSCKPNVQANHNAGDQVANVTVTVSYTCTGEAYDQDGAVAAATQWLKDDATKSPGTGYVLVGQVKTTVNQVQITDASQGTVSISVNAEGIWVYQFDDAQKAQLAQALAGKSKSVAQTTLQNWQGVKQDTIQLVGNGTLLPSDAHQISIVIQPVTGL